MAMTMLTGWAASALAVAPPLQIGSLSVSSAGPGDAGGFFGNIEGTPARWYNQNIVIADRPVMNNDPSGEGTDFDLTALDYRFNGSAATSITANPLLTFSNEGIYTFEATGTYSATGYIASTTLGLDKTRPTSTCDAVPVYDAAANITLRANDALSGPEFVLYSLDGASDYATPTANPGSTDQLVAPIQVTTPGAHTLSWFAVDTAGNFEKPHLTTFWVNPVPYKPVLSKPAVKVKKRKITVSGSVTPATTGRTVIFTVNRKAGSKFKFYGTYAMSLPMYYGSYSALITLKKAGTYQVLAAENDGLSAWSKSFTVK
jgi:hypothetical protein